MITTLWCRLRSLNIVLRAIRLLCGQLVSDRARVQREERRRSMRAQRPGSVADRRMEKKTYRAKLAADRNRSISTRHADAETFGDNRTNKNAASVSRSGVLVSNIERGRFLVLGRPGSDLLSQGLSHSTIGAEEFNGRVRDGIGLRLFAKTTRPAKDKKTKQAIFVWRLAPLIHSGHGSSRSYGH